MPSIYRWACGSCDYSVQGILSHTYVVMDDGSELTCPHPTEVGTAEAATGKHWQELATANRLIYRYALVCLACGHMDYYGPRDLSGQATYGGHIASIVHNPTPGQAAHYTCKTCGVRRLYPLCGSTGCLVGLLKLVGLFRKRLTCPRCHQGVIHPRSVGKS